MKGKIWLSKVWRDRWMEAGNNRGVDECAEGWVEGQTLRKMDVWQDGGRLADPSAGRRDVDGVGGW
jgi:hypothetical protein